MEALAVESAFTKGEKLPSCPQKAFPEAVSIPIVSMITSCILAFRENKISKITSIGVIWNGAREVECDSLKLHFFENHPSMGRRH